MGLVGEEEGAHSWYLTAMKGVAKRVAVRAKYPRVNARRLV